MPLTYVFLSSIKDKTVKMGVLFVIKDKSCIFVENFFYKR